eukprot:scaffold34925_cov150-Amphora_coffeaeformis.AAC.2
MDSGEPKGGLVSEYCDMSVAALRGLLDTKEELIQLKDARILDLIATIQTKNKEIESKDGQIKELKVKLKESEKKSSAKKTPSRRDDGKKRPPGTTGNSEGSDNDKPPETQTKPSSSASATPKNSARHQENRASNGDSGRDEDLDDSPPASVFDDDDDDDAPSLDGGPPGRRNAESKSTAEMTAEIPKAKASPMKKRARTDDTSETSTTDASVKKPPRKKKKPSETKESTEDPQKPWEESYQELVEFKRKFGLKKAPSRKEFPDLSRFYQYQRNKYNQYKQGEMPKDMTLERMEKLEALGFADTRRTPGEKGWEMRFQELKAFKEQNGHFRVSRHENYQLWGWVKTQRAGYRNLTDALTKGTTIEEKPGVARLTPEHMAKLQSIGFEWEVQNSGYEASWERRFTELLQFKSEHGTTHVPRNYSPNIQLAMWVKDQRKKYAELQKGLPRRGLLTDDRIARLDAIGFEWRVRP